MSGLLVWTFSGALMGYAGSFLLDNTWYDALEEKMLIVIEFLSAFR